MARDVAGLWLSALYVVLLQQAKKKCEIQGTGGWFGGYNMYIGYNGKRVKGKWQKGKGGDETLGTPDGIGSFQLSAISLQLFDYLMRG